MNTDSDHQSNKPRIVAGVVLGIFIACFYFVSQGKASDPKMFGLLVVQLVEELSLVAGWLLAAVGFGWIGTRTLIGRENSTVTLQFAFGAGILMFLDWLLGCLGYLNLTTAWLLGGIGWALIVFQVREHRDAISRPEAWPDLPSPAALAVPAIAMLMGAALIAPGFKGWPYEMGGYDVLSYHLQLPKEWMKQGQIVPLEHNVYSYFPSFLESAFLHLGYWRGPGVMGPYKTFMLNTGTAAQLLHAIFTIVAGVTIGRTVSLLVGRYIGTFVGALYLATPWVIVTGSMAYNEQAMMMFGAAGLRLALLSGGWISYKQLKISRERQALTIGIFCGFATLTKLTALGGIVLPIILILFFGLLTTNRKQLVKSMAIMLATFMVIISCWLIRNAMWTGNPTFPMLTELFGWGHWDADQVARWNAAHIPDFERLPLGERISRFFFKIIFDLQFGMLIWPLLIIACWRGLTHPSKRTLTRVLLIALLGQLIFWLTMTHVQPRFAIPFLLPICVLIGLGLGGISNEKRTIKIIGVVVIGLSTLSVYKDYRAQFSPGYGPQIGTTEMIPSAHQLWSNIHKLPRGSRVLSEGYAMPYYAQLPFDYHTVWDKSLLGELIEKHGLPGAVARLRQMGYTHLLVDENMIVNIWLSPGNYGYDRNITKERLMALRRSLEVLLSNGDPEGPLGNLVLYRLQPPPPSNR